MIAEEEVIIHREKEVCHIVLTVCVYAHVRICQLLSVKSVLK
jgi:hypothetical protein